MPGLRTRALAVDLGPGIGAVELDVLHAAALVYLDAPPTGLLQSLQDLVLDLGVPRIVILAGLQHGTRSRHGVAPTLHLDRVEVGPVLQVVVAIELSRDQVARVEGDEPIWPGSDRFQVCRRVARFVAFEGLEQVLGDDHAAGANEGVGPERRRPCKQNTHR